MNGNCDHSGFHSGVGRLSQDLRSIRFIVVCDGCGQEMREIHVESYAPDFDPSTPYAPRDRRAA